MQKPKEYDWKDSNMALFGTDADRKVKKESAATEPAWEGAGAEPGLQIFRVVKFEIEQWPKEQYGEFYSGDSYIILNTYKEEGNDELKYDVHFWIGKYSSQDEYGTAAYKTVELDTLLDDKAVQHREVMGSESALFQSYFEEIQLLKGGADTGFSRVLPEAYKVRLLRVSKGDNKVIVCKELSPKKGNLTTGDVFIIDNGIKIYQWNGKESTHDERYKAASVISKIMDKRAECSSDVLDEDSTGPGHTAMMLLRDGESKPKGDVPAGTPEMFKISDADGTIGMDAVDYGKDSLNGDDVFVINNGNHCFCWVGSGASIDERRNAMSYACNYLNKTATPWLPITVVAEGNEPAGFEF